MTRRTSPEKADVPWPPGAGAGVGIDGVSMGYVAGVHVVRDVSLQVAPGEIVALLGPSGCGKTSLLRAVAGLERIRTGTITVGAAAVSGPGVWVKPEHRRVGMVFQDGALFPHLTVAANVAFGLRPRRRQEAARRVEEVLALVDLPGYGNRLPRTLSGGQQQRVALARSLAPAPAVLLLDEPFSALDAALRVQVRTEVARIVREIGVTTLFVTHDQDEAFVLGDRVAVMRDGRVEQIDTPKVLYQRPTTAWVASFVGEANLVPGRLGPGRCAATSLGSIAVEPDPAAGSPADIGTPGDELVVLVRPEQVSVVAARAADGGSLATVEAVEYHGRDVRYRLRLDDGTVVTARCGPDAVHLRGSRVRVGYRGAGTTAAWAALSP